MSILNRPINELDLVSVLLVALLAMLLLFDRDFGLIYVVMIVIWFVFYIKDRLFFNKSISFPIEHDPRNRLTDVLIAAGVYAVFLLVASVVTNLLTPGALPAGSLYEVIKTMSGQIQQASTPYLQSSLILMFVGWVILIPIIETSTAAKILEAMIDKLKNKTLVAILMLCLLLGAGFAILHLTAENGNSTSLVITFIFFTATAVLIWQRKSVLSAIILHIIANFFAVYRVVFGGS